MGWKLFAVVSTVFLISGLVEFEFRDGFDVFGTILTLPATLGLLLYAFGVSTQSGFWRAYSLVFALWSFAAVAIMASRSLPIVATNKAGPIGLALAVALFGAASFFQWLALRRLSRGEVIAR